MSAAGFGSVMSAKAAGSVMGVRRAGSPVLWALAQGALAAGLVALVLVGARRPVAAPGRRPWQS